MRLLPYEAAISVAWGLPRDEALRAMTIDAAEILGVADRVGSIEPGKMANLVDLARAIRWSCGRRCRASSSRAATSGTDSKHTELYERFSSRPMPVKK